MPARTLKRHRPRQRRTRETRRIEALLASAMAGAKVDAYRYNSASIRVRVLSSSFRNLTRVQREEIVLPLLRRLPDDIYCDITMLVLLTPAERRNSMISTEFDRPTPSLI